MNILRSWVDVVPGRCMYMYVLFRLPFCPDPFLFKFYGYQNQSRPDYGADREMATAINLLRKFINEDWDIAPRFCRIVAYQEGVGEQFAEAA